jgi:hypothetical protein
VAGARRHLNRRALLPPLGAVGIAAVYGMLDDGRDLGSVLAHLVLLLVLIGVAIPLGIMAARAAWQRRPSRAPGWFIAALLLAGLLPVAGLIMTWPRDQLRLLAWSLRDGEALARPGVVGEWEAWGFAGMTNLSFLVAEPDDALTLARAEARWGHASCDIVGVRRLRAGIFVVTTMNCDLM